MLALRFCWSGLIDDPRTKRGTSCLMLAAAGLTRKVRMLEPEL